MSLFLCKFAATVLRAMETRKRITDKETQLVELEMSIKSLERGEKAYQDFIASMDPEDSTYLHMGMLMEKTRNRLVHAIVEYAAVEKEIAALRKVLHVDSEYVATTWRVWANEARRLSANKRPFKFEDIMDNVTILMRE